MGELLSREYVHKDQTLFRMNQNGQRDPEFNCCPSHPGALEIVAESAVEFFASVRPQDSNGSSACRGFAVGGIRRVRFTSPHPNDFSDRVIAAMAETPAVCEYVHLPAQSGSTPLLRRMLRRYTREQYLDVVRRLREAIPGLALSTDLIVGFPGETDADFDATLSLVREVGASGDHTSPVHQEI